MKEYEYRTRGTCSRMIRFKSDGSKVYDVEFIGGCNGNTQGISKLVEGMDKEKVVELLSGINCNGKGTSCPDQLARAVTEISE